MYPRHAHGCTKGYASGLEQGARLRRDRPKALPYLRSAVLVRQHTTRLHPYPTNAQPAVHITYTQANITRIRNNQLAANRTPVLECTT